MKSSNLCGKLAKIALKKDPPNAVLSGSGIATQIVILNGIHVTKDTVSFPLSVSADEIKSIASLQISPAIKEVALTIDGDLFAEAESPSCQKKVDQKAHWNHDPC